MNSQSTDELIDQFTDYFRCQCDEIAAVESSHFRRTLYLTLLDALGRARYPKGSSHDRIVRFVQDCSGWPYIHRVSLSQLHMSLLAKQITHGALLEEVTCRLARWRDGLVCHARSEPEKSELEPLGSAAEKALITKNTYSELLYPFRNILLHEFRIPGYGMDFSDKDDEPYSHSHTGRQRQTVFPSRFVHRLCVGCISGLNAYLKAQQIDPYSRYQFGSLWKAH